MRMCPKVEMSAEGRKRQVEVPGRRLVRLQIFFLIDGCIGSLGYWQSLTTRE